MEMYPDCYLAFKGHEDYVSDIQVVDGILITCSFDGTIRTWDPQTGDIRHVMEGHRGGVRCIRALGSLLFSGSEDCTVRTWDFRDGSPVNTISGHKDWVNCLDLSKDVLFSGSSDSTIRAWKIESGDQVQSYVGHGSSVNCIQVVDTVIYSGSYDMTLRTFDIVSGECTMVMKGEYIGSVRCLLVYDGKVFAGSEEGVLRVLDPSTGQCVEQLRGHTAHIKSLRQGKSGEVLSSSGDGVIRTWSTEKLECVSYFSNSNTCFYEDTGVFYVGSADGRVKALAVDTNMEETVERFSPTKSPPRTPPEPELALWEVVGAVDSVVKKTEETQEICAKIPAIEKEVGVLSDKMTQIVNELESLLGDANASGQSSLLRNFRMEMRLLTDSVSTASQISDLAHNAATSGEMGEQTARIIQMLETRLGQLETDFRSPTELPPWLNLANQELERALVLVEQSLERTIGSVAERHTQRVTEVEAQLMAEARVRQQVEFATKQLEDDVEELTATNADKFTDLEQSIQRLELYDRGVVFQKKIDDALSDCSRALEERLEAESQSTAHSFEQVNHRVDVTQDSLADLEKKMFEIWGTDTDGADHMSLAADAQHEGNVRMTSVLGLQSQLDEAKAEMAAFRQKMEGNFNELSDQNPATVTHVEEALETAKGHTDENVSQARVDINRLSEGVKTKTELLEAQVSTLRAMCVAELPDNWEEIQAVCVLTRNFENDIVPRVEAAEATLITQGTALEEVDELEGQHSRFVAQQAKLQEHVSHDVERLWGKLREALVEPPELPRDLVYEADLTRLRQALEKRCNDVLVEASSVLARSEAEKSEMKEKLEALAKTVESQASEREAAEEEIQKIRTENAEIKQQQELMNSRVATLIQQVVEEQEARGCLEQVVNDMIGQCATILEGQRQVVSMVNSSNIATTRKGGWTNN